MGIVQEKRFEYKGLPCVILFISSGYRTGYVGLPRGTQIDVSSIVCHGGITYTDSFLHNQEDDDKWWVGFDCGHAYDGYDTEKIEEYFGNDVVVMESYRYMQNYYRMCNEWSEVRSLEYCEQECKKIVDQYLEMMKKE